MDLSTGSYRVPFLRSQNITFSDYNPFPDKKGCCIFRMPTRTEILAAGGGTVENVNEAIIIRHIYGEFTEYTEYGVFSSGNTTVKPDDVVKSGDIIGYSKGILYLDVFKIENNKHQSLRVKWE